MNINIQAISARLATGAAVAAIRAYQVGLRPLNLWGCRFHPSCSEYALEAFRLHGPRRGAWLTARRLLRCRPGVFGGIDTVPRENISTDRQTA